MLINADVGECGIEIDTLMMPHIDMANIACGGHIGDTHSVAQISTLALKYGVLIGGHISYNDTQNFGRKSPNITIDKLEVELLQQLKHFTTLNYIKPHGALYHDMMQHNDIFALMLKLSQQYQVFLVVQKDILTTEKINLAKKYGVKLFFEVYADRKYTGKYLKSREFSDAVLNNTDEIIKQYQSFNNNDNAHTICFHSDNPASVIALQTLCN